MKLFRLCGEKEVEYILNNCPLQGVGNFFENDNKKIGYYSDFINFNYKCNVVEYAINSEKIKYEYLDKIYFISDDLDFDYYPDVNEIYSCLTLKYDFEKQKKLKLIKNKFK